MRTLLLLLALALAWPLAGLGCSTTSAVGTGGRKITMLKPENQTVRRGDTNRVAITVMRRNLHSDLFVRFDNLPEGLQIVEKDKRMTDDDYVVDYTLFATNHAHLVSGHVVNVTVSTADDVSVTESFEVTVTD